MQFQNVPKCLIAVLLAVLSMDIAVAGPIVFINEFHYDNTGADSREAVEVAGPAGTDLSGWSLVLYNGATGAAYDTELLSATIPNQANGFGVVVVSYPPNGIQNGAPDGIALVDMSGVIQFLSYEGSFTAIDGPATGLTSIDIGVAELGADLVGRSLQLTGTGSAYDQFTWAAPTAETFGGINAGQRFVATVPESPTLALILIGLTGIALARRNSRRLA